MLWIWISEQQLKIFRAVRGKIPHEYPKGHFEQVGVRYPLV